jgi:SAM-dependent methyltransferase
MPTGARGRGLSFGSAAEQYERYRLDYPDELVDAVLEYAKRPVRLALDVGAGTGKATRLFASRGIEVTALEPDADMAQVLGRTTRDRPVDLVVSTFEEFDTACRFDLVYAGASWHWTDPARRWARAVELLVPGGVLALFGSPGELQDPVLRAAVDDIEKQVLPDDDPAVIHPWSWEEMTGAEGLTCCAQRDLPVVAVTYAADFVQRLATVSAYLQLGPVERAEALRRIRAALPDRFDVDATVRLSLARKA